MIHPPDYIKHFLTVAQRDQVCTLASYGIPDERAVEAAGITIEMLEMEEHFDAHFADRLAHSRLCSEVNVLRDVISAAKDKRTWRAAAWLLERLHPERYALRKPFTFTRGQLEEHLRRTGALVASMLPTDIQRLVEKQIQDLITDIHVVENSHADQPSSPPPKTITCPTPRPGDCGTPDHDGPAPPEPN